MRKLDYWWVAGDDVDEWELTHLYYTVSIVSGSIGSRDKASVYVVLLYGDDVPRVYLC